MTLVMANITGVFVRVDDCYFAYVKEEPSAITEGRTIEEAMNNLIDAYTQIRIARKKRRGRKEAAEREIKKRETIMEKVSRNKSMNRLDKQRGFWDSYKPHFISQGFWNSFKPHFLPQKVKNG